MTGIGEMVEPLPHVDAADHADHPAAAREHAGGLPGVGRTRPAGEQSGERNDLEAAALVVEPQLARWRDEILRHIGVAPTLAGSGATWFLEGDVDVGVRPGSRHSSATIVRTHTVDAGRATGPGA